MPRNFRFHLAFLLLCAVLALPLHALAQGESSQNPHVSRPNYRRGGLGWDKKLPPDSTRIRYSVFLIGDVGKPISKANGGEPSLNFLRKKIMEAGAKSATIYLGDNVYEFGMPEEGAFDRKASEERLRDQIDVLRGYQGEKYMIPGNHDWKQGLKGGFEQVMREQRFAENYMANDSAAFSYTGDFITPSNGCPGPYEIRLQDDLVLITINSQWFLTNRDERPYGAAGGCGVEDETDFMAQLEDIIARNQRKNIIVVGHHPLFSDGVHGGYFTLGDYIFPLSIVYKYAFLPLPVIGAIYPLARKYGGVSQDLAYPAYQAYKKGLMDIFNKYPNVIYACGHEHNLQYFKEGATHFIVSGSGCKTQHVKPGNGGGALFSDKEKGWARVNYYDDGQVWTEYFVPEGNGDRARLVFRTPLYAKTTAGVPSTPVAPITPVEKQKKKDKNAVVAPSLPIHRADFRDSSVVVAIDPGYNQHGKFHNWLLGEHYRQEWATPVKFPLLDLAHDKGGLVPYKTGGGRETASLKLRNEEGHNFSLRGIDKDPAAVLPEALRTGFAKDILQDQISAQHPYAPFALPPLASAAGILHTNPVRVYIPQDPLLGQYYGAFSDHAAALEEDAKDDQSNVASLNYAKNLVSTDKMLEHLLEDNDNSMDQVEFARSRLFDMWIGDWDRHEDQWRWAEVKDKNGNRTYTAVPEDRDIAFFKGDGVLPFLISRKFAVRNFQNFGYDFGDYKGLNLTGLSNDRTFMGGVTREEWVAQAQYMKEHLTDAIIEKALRDNWPKEIYDLHGPEIIAKLKSRRDLLPDVAAKYANVVANIVEVRGTRKNERFTVERLPNGNTHLTVQKINKKGKLEQTVYDRTLEYGITDELRIYGISGKDVYDLKGKAQKGIKIRLVGGTGRDSIIDNSNISGMRHKVQVYDADTGNFIKAGPDSRLRLEPGVDVSRYDHPKRFDLKDYRLNYTGPALFFGYNIDDGFLLGGGVTHRRYGFRRDPFSSEQSIVANFAPARNGAYNIKYTGQFTRVFGRYDLRVAAQYYGPQLLYNFFGIGNNTANLATEYSNHGAITNRTVNTAYRVRFNSLVVAPTLERSLFSFLKAGFGPRYEQFRVEQSPIGSVIKDSIGGNFENRHFGIRASDFQTNQYLGGLVYLNLDASSSPKNPRIGIRWYNEAQYNYQLNGENLQYGRLTSEIRAYLTPNLPFQITYAGRIGVARNLGDYRFYQANTLGGTTNLRGYRRTRYAGRGSLYANFEARIQLLSFNAYLFPGKLGIMGLADAGRVYSDQDTSTGFSALHSGFGGGVYVDILKQAIINMTYSVGEEKLVFVGFDFLF